jgi:hypothetical protein
VIVRGAAKLQIVGNGRTARRVLNHVTFFKCAPDLSVMVPSIVPWLPDCAQATQQERRSTQVTMTLQKHERFMTPPREFLIR